MNKLFSIIAMLFLMATIVLLWATQGTKENNPVAQSGDSIVTEEKNAAIIGGEFNLVDQAKQPRTHMDFRGKPMLVFFGFTHCPDICPVTVSTFSSLMELLGDKADQIVPIFITVDPARDTPEVMNEYLSNFDKRIVGLTGSEEEIKKVAEAYKVFYKRSKQTPAADDETDSYGEEATEDAHANHADHSMHGGNNYLVDHSGFIYLMDREGNYVEHFRYDVSEQELADALKKHLE